MFDYSIFIIFYTYFLYYKKFDNEIIKYSCFR